jgi:type III restriction enzyme
MGFDKDEAEENIQPAQLNFEEGEGLFGRQERPRHILVYRATATPEVLNAVAAHAGEAISVQETEGGRVELKVTGALSTEAEQAIYAALEESERQGFAAAAAQHRHAILQTLSPAEQGKPFTVPRLMAHVQGELQFADTDTFMEFHEVPLLDYPARLEEREFGIRETARSFELDLDGNKLFFQFADEQEQFSLDIPVEGWTEKNLVLWLDGQGRQKDISQVVLLRWLQDLVSYLTHTRKLHINVLMRLKFILSRKIKEKIDAARVAARTRAYPPYLFAPEAKVEVSFDDGFSFKEGMYWEQRRYRGSYRFKRHFLGADNVPAFDGAEGGEEYQCAQALDSLGEVEYWIRNVARHPASFWLPTASDKFYPDFVALLKDDRLFVVEYKGALLADDADTNEKRIIGLLWERHMQSKGLFLVVEKTVESLDMRAQLERKIRDFTK